MRKFYDLLRESVIVQASIALIMTVTICYLYAINQNVPEYLQTIMSLIIGFYFGTKAARWTQG